MHRACVVGLGIGMLIADPLSGQSPRAANPERPTVATHAYAVAPGYWELEQGLRVFGLGNFAEGRAWDFNLKIGLRDQVQLGVFATGIGWTGGASGVGDLGLALKLWQGLGESGALAVVPAATFPTGNVSLGLGAGRVLGSLVAVWSQDLAGGFHTDVNVGPVGLGAGTPQLFGSFGLAAAHGRWALAGELFRSRPVGRDLPRRVCSVRRCSRWWTGRFWMQVEGGGAPWRHPISCSSASPPT